MVSSDSEILQAQTTANIQTNLDQGITTKQGRPKQTYTLDISELVPPHTASREQKLHVLRLETVASTTIPL